MMTPSVQRIRGAVGEVNDVHVILVRSGLIGTGNHVSRVGAGYRDGSREVISSSLLNHGRPSSSPAFLATAVPSVYR